MNKKIYSVVVLVCVVVLVAWWVVASYVVPYMNAKKLPETPAVVVSMTDEGFSPNEFTVKVGDRVDFVNTSAAGYYWPASDLHPTHELYADFDPRAPVAPGETWSFVFERVGVWRMHDHVHPNVRGAVTVVE